MSSCPFLNGTAMSLIRKTPLRVLQRLPECPIMSRAVSTKLHTGPTQESSDASTAVARQCPFLVKKFDTQRISEIGLEKMPMDSADNVNGVTGVIKPSRSKAFHPVIERCGKSFGKSNVSQSCLFFSCNHQTLADAEICGVCGTSQSSLTSPQSHTSTLKVDTATPMQDAKEKGFDYESHFENMLAAKQKDHSYRVFKKIQRKGKSFPKAKEHTNTEKDVVVWCSNDYMGMSWHPDVTNAAKSAIDLQGTGSGGTRNISGNLILHETLEQMMAEQHRKDAALVFTSCYVANQWALHSLGRYLPGCVFISDANNHASMIQGVLSSGAKKMIYKHNSLEDLEAKLKSIPLETPKVVAFESVHSMNGSMAPIEAVCDLAHEHGALTFLDEVHAVGLYGERGAGAAEEFGCAHKVDVVSGTFGKAYGNIGGYVAGSAAFIDFVRSYASGFIFTTSLPPATLAGALTAVRTLAGDEGRQLRAHQRFIVRTLRSRLQELGIPAIECPTHIIPVHVGDPRVCLAISNELLNEHGIYVQSINFPTVARGEECLRIAPTPHHSLEDVDRLVRALAVAWAKQGGPHIDDPSVPKSA